MAAARTVSESTVEAVLAAIENDLSITDEQLAEQLSLRPATIYSAVLALMNRKLIERDSAAHVWIRTTPPWMR